MRESTGPRLLGVAQARGDSPSGATWLRGSGPTIVQRFSLVLEGDHQEASVLHVVSDFGAQALDPSSEVFPNFKAKLVDVLLGVGVVCEALINRHRCVVQYGRLNPDHGQLEAVEVRVNEDIGRDAFEHRLHIGLRELAVLGVEWFVDGGAADRQQQEWDGGKRVCNVHGSFLSRWG